MPKEPILNIKLNEWTTLNTNVGEMKGLLHGIHEQVTKANGRTARLEELVTNLRVKIAVIGASSGGIIAGGVELIQYLLTH